MRALTRSSLSRTTESCLCGGAAVDRIRLGRDREGISCRGCGLLSRSRMPTAEDLARWYGEGYWECYGRAEIGPARANLHAHALDWLESRLGGPGTLVDVGCGCGALLQLGRRRGWRAIGFDLSAQAVAHARQLGLEAHRGSWPPCPLADAVADAVTFVDVLDHLIDPAGALREAWRVLRPRGPLYVRVPNAPWHVRLMPLLSVVGLRRLAVFHLFGFGRRAMEFHLRRAGFEVLSIRTSPPGRAAAWPSADPLERVLKELERGVYGLLVLARLDRRTCGWSIEALAEKAERPTSPTGAVASGEVGA